MCNITRPVRISKVVLYLVIIDIFNTLHINYNMTTKYEMYKVNYIITLSLIEICIPYFLWIAKMLCFHKRIQFISQL